MSGAANRDNLVIINWFITKSQHELLDKLSLDGRSRSEHLRNAIDAYLDCEGVLDLEEPLVKADFSITRKQKTAIGIQAASWGCSEAAVLRTILFYLQKKHSRK
ncbi:hypothetical protein [Brevibacillus brevis]|uniref:Ribbon-helix-helix protein CopG domain-containing protein n=1 Tax=Brevibacillus brevis TaxID=1393 RepID=A0ABY9TE55_BREBE|nr:hypothetical protein [Brevibacillus brevis]WNC17954.1 hypothetical protein RGB73_30330 [Brevibacillus brevis]